MQKVITMTHFNRPKYSHLAMKWLSRCRGVSDYKIVCYLEHSDIMRQMKNVIYSHSANLDIQVVECGNRLGNSKNTQAALYHGFSIADYVIHVEDDILLYPDALEYFEYCGKKFKQEKEVVNICSFVRLLNHVCPLENSNLMRTRRWFIPWGWATWKDRFDRMVELDVFNDLPGFDNNINTMLNGLEVHPLISRSQNIGASNGCHVESEVWHLNNHYTPIWMESYKFVPNLKTEWKMWDE
jgi:hypothetical protein